MGHLVITQRGRHRPLLGVAVSFGLGILINEYIYFSYTLMAFLVFLFLLAALLTQEKKLLSTIFLLGSIILLGALFSKSHQALPRDHIYHVAKYYRKDPVLIEGVITSDVEDRDFFKGKKTTFTLNVKRFRTRWGWKEKSGRILVNIFRHENLTYGDYLRLEGKLHEPFEFSKDGTFSYREFLNRKGIKLILSVKKQGRVKVIERNLGNFIKSGSLRVKHRLNDILFKYLSENEAAIMQAVLLGERYNIPKHIRNLFQICGVSHILAISGLHLGIVAFLVFLFLKMIPMPRRARYASVIILLVFYAFLTGSRPSVVRATIMVSIFLASFIIERESEVYNTLSLAALVLLLMNPLNLFDVGFQLSFVSVFFIIYFYPKFMNGFSGWDLRTKPAFMVRLASLVHHWSKSRTTLSEQRRKVRRESKGYLVPSCVVSLSAFIGVAGLIAYYFHMITPIAVLANLVVIPLISAIIALGMGLLFSAVALPIAAPAFAACLKLLLNLMGISIFLFAQIPGACVQLRDVPLWGVVLYYILLFLGMYGKLIINRVFLT